MSFVIGFSPALNGGFCCDHALMMVRAGSNALMYIKLLRSVALGAANNMIQIN